MNGTFRIPWLYLLAISLTGLGIGFLVGLSASPVVNALIGGIVSLAAGVVSALCGVRLEKSEAKEAKDSPDIGNPNQAVPPQGNPSAFAAHVNPVPIAFLVISIVLGALLGLHARTREWFAESTDHLVAKWENSTGLTKKEIATRLFDSIYGTTKSEGKTSEEKPSGEKTGGTASPQAGVLFAASADKCKQLRRYHPENPGDAALLRLELEGLDPKLKELASKCKDEDLWVILDVLVCPNEHAADQRSPTPPSPSP
jgi:hypothetical protein